MAGALRITLVRSVIGRIEKHRRIVRSLGLRKLNSTVILRDTPSARGMINKVSYLLRIEEISDATP